MINHLIMLNTLQFCILLFTAILFIEQMQIDWIKNEGSLIGKYIVARTATGVYSRRQIIDADVTTLTTHGDIYAGEGAENVIELVVLDN